MKVHKIQPHVTAVIPKDTVISRVGCNVGLIHTHEGVVLVVYDRRPGLVGHAGGSISLDRTPA